MLGKHLGIDYEIHLLNDKFYSVMISGEACGAYCEEYKTHYNFELTTGKKIDLIKLIKPNMVSNLIDTLNQIKKSIIKEAREKNDFSAQMLKKYDEKIYKRLGPELQISTRLQSLVKYQSLFNFVVNKANKNKTLRDTISSMFVDVDLRSKFKNPLFYLKLIFN
jgi:hypothetical protein